MKCHTDALGVLMKQIICFVLVILSGSVLANDKSCHDLLAEVIENIQVQKMIGTSNQEVFDAFNLYLSGVNKNGNKIYSEMSKAITRRMDDGIISLYGNQIKQNFDFVINGSNQSAAELAFILTQNLNKKVLVLTNGGLGEKYLFGMSKMMSNKVYNSGSILPYKVKGLDNILTKQEIDRIHVMSLLLMSNATILNESPSAIIKSKNFSPYNPMLEINTFNGAIADFKSMIVTSQIPSINDSNLIGIEWGNVKISPLELYYKIMKDKDSIQVDNKFKNILIVGKSDETIALVKLLDQSSIPFYWKIGEDFSLNDFPEDMQDIALRYIGSNVSFKKEVDGKAFIIDSGHDGKSKYTDKLNLDILVDGLSNHGTTLDDIFHGTTKNDPEVRYQRKMNILYVPNDEVVIDSDLKKIIGDDNQEMIKTNVYAIDHLQGNLKKEAMIQLIDDLGL